MSLSACLDVCWLCNSIENDLEPAVLSGEHLCTTCQLRTEIVTKGIELQDALVSGKPKEPGGRPLSEKQFDRAMETYYLAFHATGADLNTFDKLFMQLLDAKNDVTGGNSNGVIEDRSVSSEQQKDKSRKIGVGRWRVVLSFLVALFVTVLSLVALMTPPLGRSVGRISETRSLVDRGKQLIQAGEFEEAVLFYDDRIRERPNVAASYYRRGVAQFCRHQFFAASADFSRAIEIDPGNNQFQAAFALAEEKGLASGLVPPSARESD